MAQAPDNSPIKPEAQRRYWNAWNARFRLGTAKLPETSSRQARIIIEWLKGIGKRESNILEIGCGTGWLCVQLAEFGRVTGIDISDEVLGKTATGVPNITFVAGDFLHLELPVRQFDVIVTLEVLSHVADQTAFIEKIASLLRPGGYLALTTQNRIALSRCSNVQPLAEGQIRQWVDANTLRPMLSRHFELLEFKSIVPAGDRGFLRWVNSPKLNWIVSVVVSQARLDALKERLFWGHTLMAFARKSNEEIT